MYKPTVGRFYQRLGQVDYFFSQCCFTPDLNLGPLKMQFTICCSPTKQRSEDIEIDNEFVVSMMELMINSLIMNGLEIMS